MDVSEPWINKRWETLIKVVYPKLENFKQFDALLSFCPKDKFLVFRFQVTTLKNHIKISTLLLELTKNSIKGILKQKTSWYVSGKENNVRAIIELRDKEDEKGNSLFEKPQDESRNYVSCVYVLEFQESAHYVQVNYCKEDNVEK